MRNILDGRNISKTFGHKHVLKNVSFHVEEGTLTVLVGRNGAGKTTLLSIIEGLETPDAGHLDWHLPITSAAGVHNHGIGVVFQGSVLDPMLTVVENLGLRARLYPGLKRSRIDEVLSVLGLEEERNQRYSTLSGGQRRKADIARALLNSPRLLLLDEPTTALDVETRRDMWALLNRLRSDEGLSILLTTHYLEEADHAEQVYIIDSGELIAHGSADSLIQRFSPGSLHLCFRAGTKGSEQLLSRYAGAFPKTVQNNDEIIIPHLSTAESIKVLKEVGDDLVSFTRERGTMNDVFLALTDAQGDLASGRPLTALPRHVNAPIATPPLTSGEL